MEKYTNSFQLVLHERAKDHENETMKVKHVFKSYGKTLK
jgi:hypothetical protein